MLQSGRLNTGHLSSAQRFAAAKLLQSAAFYDRILQPKGKIRRALNRGEVGNGIPRGVLQKSRRFLYSVAVRKSVSSDPGNGKMDAADSLLVQLPKTTIWKSGFYGLYRKNDRIINACYGVFTFVGTKIFGVSPGNKVVDIRQRVIANKLKSQVQPFDILLSRCSNHLTSKVIPGYFGHAAIWFGDEIPNKHRRLRDIFRFRKRKFSEIHEPGILEAVRSGVRSSSLKEYAVGDVFLILRLRSLTPGQRNTVVSNAGKQLLKAYDFNFDIESPDMVMCTELVYLAYDFIPWKVSPFMGRFTIFPDDILQTALADERFEVVALLMDGKLEVKPDLGVVRGLIARPR